MKLEKYKARLLLAASAATISMVATPIALGAQEASSGPIEEISVVGSRSQKPRTATDSPVPIDSFSSAQFNALGNSADLTDNLSSLVPSYTAAPATGDGSAFVRPTSLRGLSPDQTLVLVNGKRRHRSALVQFLVSAAGAGAQSPDIGMIPNIALKRVEVLRDGAAAQYGSDAIAGVINFVMKDANDGGEITASYGQFYQGEQSKKIAANFGLALGDTGFLNLSAEYTDNDALSRGIQRPIAQTLIDNGVQGIGADAPFGDAPFVQTWGRPETSGARIFVNAGVEIGDSAELYMFGGYANTQGRYRFFFRSPGIDGVGVHPAIAGLRASLPAGDDGADILPAGFTPFLDGDQIDLSFVTGLKGDTDSGWFYDLSFGFGRNTLSYFLNNTVNPTLGLSGRDPAQRDFDVGGYEQEEINFNADFSKPIGENVNLAFGAEWREETFTGIAGEVNSFVGAGSSGLRGVTTENAVSNSRNNYSLYVDIEHDLSEDLFFQYAARYERFSDFGSTINGKFAARYNVNENFTLRGGISTGFHAPTPGQANITTTITTFDGASGLQVEEGLLTPDNPDAIAAGAQPLTEEKSLNFSFGATASIGDATTLTVDFYRIEVDNRIFRTGDIQTPDGRTISFFTNSLDVVSEGIDVVLTSSSEWGNDATTDFSFAGSYNKVSVAGQDLVNGVQPVSASRIEDIENNYPNYRFVASADTRFNEKWNFLARARYFGSHFDERGTIGAAVDPTAEIGALVYFDIELGYQVSEEFRVTAGAVNVFNTFVDEIGAGNANRLSVGLQYPRRSAANYEGGSWYLRASYQF